jgi:hypothetical protein
MRSSFGRILQTHVFACREHRSYAMPLESLTSVALGIGLAAATGFRLFLPLLLAGLAARTGFIPLSDGFSWLASTPALLMLGTAAVFETLAYYIPGIDHLLDLVAGPLALAAGVIASASVMTDLDPALMWPIAIIAGGGIAGVTKGSSALVRAKTGLATAGLGNPVVSTFETFSAFMLSVIAIALPIVAVITVIALLVWLTKKFGKLAFSLRRKP